MPSSFIGLVTLMTLLVGQFVYVVSTGTGGAPICRCAANGAECRRDCDSADHSDGPLGCCLPDRCYGIATGHPKGTCVRPGRCLGNTEPCSRNCDGQCTLPAGQDGCCDPYGCVGVSPTHPTGTCQPPGRCLNEGEVCSRNCDGQCTNPGGEDGCCEPQECIVTATNPIRTCQIPQNPGRCVANNELCSRNCDGQCLLSGGENGCCDPDRCGGLYASPTGRCRNPSQCLANGEVCIEFCADPEISWEDCSANVPFCCEPYICDGATPTTNLGKCQLPRGRCLNLGDLCTRNCDRQCRLPGGEDGCCQGLCRDGTCQLPLGRCQAIGEVCTMSCYGECLYSGGPTCCSDPNFCAFGVGQATGTCRGPSLCLSSGATCTRNCDGPCPADPAIPNRCRDWCENPFAGDGCCQPHSCVDGTCQLPPGTAILSVYENYSWG